MTAKESRNNLAEEAACPDALVESTAGYETGAPMSLEGGRREIHAKAGPCSTLLPSSHEDILSYHDYVCEATEVTDTWDSVS